MPARKKKKKKKHAFELPEEKIQLINELIKAPQDLTREVISEKITDPKLASVFIDRIPAEKDYISSALIIKELFGNEKPVIKSIKKLIFRLKQKGISPAELEYQEPESPVLMLKTELPEPISYIGPVGYGGHRMFFISIPYPGGIYETGTGFISDSGIPAFYHSRQRKKEMKRNREVFFEHTDTYIETTLDHMATLLERAYRIEERPHDENYIRYSEFRNYLLEKAKPLDRHPIYSLIPEQDIKDQPLTSSMISSLLEHDLMKSWIIPPDEMKPVLEEIEEVENSPIYLTPEQKNERVYSIKKEAIQKIFSGEKLEHLKYNLLEMAYFFFKKEEKTPAKTALICAESLKQDDTLSIVPSFLEALMDRMITLYKDYRDKAQEEQKSSSDLILPP